MQVIVLDICIEKNIVTPEEDQFLIKVGGIQGTVYAGLVKQALKKHLGL